MILMSEKEKPATLMMEGEGCDREVLQRRRSREKETG